MAINKNKGQALFSLATLDGIPVEPRTYAQSTSGRTFPQGTAPPLSRSIEMASDSPMRCPFETALRKYPTEVPQRRAKSSWAARSKELRYDRMTSMPEALPKGNVQSIPAGHLPVGNRRYAVLMADPDLQSELYAHRRLRLAELAAVYGTHVKLAAAITALADRHPDLVENLKSFTDPSYISRALKGPTRIENGKTVGMKGGKNIGEEPAAALEVIFSKPEGWMSDREPRKKTWPFAFSRALWEQLNFNEKEDAERQFMIYINGLLGTRKKAGSN